MAMGGFHVLLVFAGLLCIPSVSNDGSSSLNKSSSTELTVRDVYLALKKVSPRWYTLGFLLELTPDRLDVLSQGCTNDVDVCYLKMLHAWHDSDLNSSWDKITWALDQLGENRLAKSIREEYIYTCNHDSYTHSSCKCEDTETKRNVLRNHEERMQEIEDGYIELAFQVMTSMEETRVDLKKVKFWLGQLPVNLKYTHRHFLEDIQLISRAESLLEVFNHLASYWNFLDYGLLEYMAIKFGNGEVKRSMRRYKHELTEFRKSVTLSEFMRLWPNRVKPPPQFSKLVIKLNRTKSHLTLQDLEEIRLSFARNYSLVTFALMYGAFEEGSLVLTWFIPSSIASQLVQDVKNGGSRFLKEHGITEVSIDGHTVAIVDSDGRVWNLVESLTTPMHFWRTRYAYFLQPGNNIMLSCSKTCAKPSPPIWYHTLSKDPWLPMSLVATGPELELSLHQPPVTTDVGYFCCACVGDHPKVDANCFGVAYMPHVAHFSITRKGKGISGVRIGDHIKVECEVYGFPPHLDIAGHSEIVELPQYSDVSWYSKIQFINVPNATTNHSGVYTCAALLHASPDLYLMTENVKRSVVVHAPPTMTQHDSLVIIMPAITAMIVTVVAISIEMLIFSKEGRKKYRTRCSEETLQTTRYTEKTGKAAPRKHKSLQRSSRKPKPHHQPSVSSFALQSKQSVKSDPSLAKYIPKEYKPFMPVITISGVSYPTGIAVSDRREIAVTEQNCISIFTCSGEKIRTLRISSEVCLHPHGVTFDSAGNILVTDVPSHCIKKFTPEGKFLTAVGGKGTEGFEFSYPAGIGIHHTNTKLYICDRYNHRIQILKKDLTLSSSFGSRGRGEGLFTFPWDVAFDSIGNVYIADSVNHCIQVFTPEGRFLRKFGKKGSGEGELSLPSGVCIDSDDIVYVTERNNHRVSVFTCQGKFMQSFGTEGERPGEFNQPWAVAVDESGLVYVCDTLNNRVQGFKNLITNRS